MQIYSLVEKLVDSERSQRKIKEEVTELREKCHDLEVEKRKLLSTVDKLKLKCKSLETETTNAVEDKINVHGKTCSLFSSCENEPSRKPQRLQKCCSWKTEKKPDVESEATVVSSEMHSTMINYEENSQESFVGQINDLNLLPGTLSQTIDNDNSDNIYSSNSAVLTDDGIHKLCIVTTDVINTDVSMKDKKEKAQHPKFSARKDDERIIGNATVDYSNRNQDRQISSSASGKLVQAYVGGSGDSGLSLEDSSSTSPSTSNKINGHKEHKFDIVKNRSSPKASVASNVRSRRSSRISSRQPKQNHVIENDEDEFILIPSLRREDDESSTPLTSEESVSDENEEVKPPYLERQENKESVGKSKVPECFSSHSRIRRIDDEDEDDEEDGNEMFDSVNETPLYQHYYERNVMLEEATTVDAHQISIGSLKRQFAGTAEQEIQHVPFRPNKVRPEKHRMSSSGSNDEGMVLDGDRYSSSGSSKSTRSRSTSSPNKSVNQMEDEFSSELTENETRTVSRRSIVSRNSLIFSEPTANEENCRPPNNKEASNTARSNFFKSTLSGTQPNDNNCATKTITEELGN